MIQEILKTATEWTTIFCAFLLSSAHGFWHWLENSHHEILSLFTIGLCIVTGALAWYTRQLFAATMRLSNDAEESGERQARQTQESIEQLAKSGHAMRDMADAMRISTMEAKRAADSAAELVAVTGSAAKRQLRPHIALDKLEFTRNDWDFGPSSLKLSPGESFLQLTIKNYGQTPGYSIAVFMHVEVKEIEDTVYLPFRPKFGAPVFITPMLSPNQVTTFNTAVNPDFIFISEEGRVYGVIEYDDPIMSVHRRFEFCYRYLGSNVFQPSGPFNVESGTGSRDYSENFPAS